MTDSKCRFLLVWFIPIQYSQLSYKRSRLLHSSPSYIYMETKQKAAMFVFITCSAIFVLCSPPLAAAKCTRNPVIFNFGDSNSDTGGFPAAHGYIFNYPYGRTFFHRPFDRLCDGRLIIDFLCENVEMDYLSSYLESLTPHFKNGVNFAVSGSQTLPKSVLFSLSTQLLQFSRFRNRSLEFHSKGIKGMLGEENFENALYMIDIGQNDISDAMSNPHIDGEERMPMDKN